MDCKTCRGLLPQYVDGTLDEAQRHKIEAHLRRCRECAGALASCNTADGSPIVRVVAAIISEAIRQGASDIHIEPGPERFRVLHRVDGVLQTATELAMELHPSLVNRFKVLAGLTPVNRRLPQEGVFPVRHANNEYRFRVSILDAAGGEKLVMRIARATRGSCTAPLDGTGLRGERLEAFRGMLRQPSGLILVTGTSGNGRTTTCYSALHELNHEGIGIMTAERLPIVPLEGITQVEVKSEAGLGFGETIRALLDHSPDVIFCGDLPDRDAAGMCLEAALSGHLVIAAMCARTERDAIQRMLDFGIPPHLIRETLLGATCQRLVGKLCPACRAKRPLTETDAEWLRSGGIEAPPEFLWQAPGCEACSKRRVKGRVGAFGVAVGSEATAPSESAGLRSLREDAARRVAEGEVAIETARRAVGG